MRPTSSSTASTWEWRLNSNRALAAFLLTALLVAAPQQICAAEPGKSKEAASTVAAPFARVFLALRGCTSCSHCRTSIRQMVRSNAKGGEATFGDDKVEVRYASPRPVPLRDVIRSLAQNRLHDLSVVDVLFEATGTLAVAQDGSRRFILADTGQSFPIALATGVRPPAPGASVRVVALVEGWRSKGSLSLVAREVRIAA